MTDEPWFHQDASLSRSRFTSGKTITLIGLNKGGITTPPPSPRLCHASTMKEKY
jgi:hypothetical protein